MAVEWWYEKEVDCYGDITKLTIFLEDGTKLNITCDAAYGYESYINFDYEGSEPHKPGPPKEDPLASAYNSGPRWTKAPW